MNVVKLKAFGCFLAKKLMTITRLNVYKILGTGYGVVVLYLPVRPTTTELFLEL
jgi:hypothetical protein